MLQILYIVIETSFKYVLAPFINIVQLEYCHG